jgi:hypothetical protein
MTISLQCALCKHYYGMLKCAAFPKLIPQEIMLGQFNHSKPFEGDHGIQREELQDGDKSDEPPKEIQELLDTPVISDDEMIELLEDDDKMEKAAYSNDAPTETIGTKSPPIKSTGFQQGITK